MPVQTARCTPRRSASAAAPLRLFSKSLRSPYLFGVGLWVSLLSFCATIVYFEQANIISAAIHDRDAQTRIFAGIDLVVNLLSLATQVFITGQVLKRFGTGIAAGALPAVYVVGFAALFLAPTLAVVVTLQIVQRWMHFAIANPARQVFFTVIGREEKYKAKNLIDVVVYRGSDALYGWVFDGFQALGPQARRHCARRVARRGRLARPVDGARPRAGTSRGAHRQRGGQPSDATPGDANFVTQILVTPTSASRAKGTR